MRALSSLLLAGAVGLGGLSLAPATAQADGGWRGRDYYRHYAPPAPLPYYGSGYGYGGYGYGGYGYGGYGYGYAPRPYYRPPPPRVFYGAPPPFFRPPPPVFHAPPRAFYGAPRSYGIPPGPGVGLFIR